MSHLQEACMAMLTWCSIQTPSSQARQADSVNCSHLLLPDSAQAVESGAQLLARSDARHFETALDRRHERDHNQLLHAPAAPAAAGSRVLKPLLEPLQHCSHAIAGCKAHAVLHESSPTLGKPAALTAASPITDTDLKIGQR